MHLTPQMYLRRFAIDGAVMGQFAGKQPRRMGTPVVGVVNGFYTIETPDGSSDEVEDALMGLEGRANRVFDQLDDGQLPLTITDKVLLAEFIGVQMCRGQQYRDLGLVVFDQVTPELRERARALVHEHAPEHVGAETFDLSTLQSQNQVVLDAIRTSRLATNALANMRWQVVRWSEPVLLSSDQPAICWHHQHESSPWGMLKATEVRMPLSPTQALITSWHDGPDVSVPIQGDRMAAMSMNFHTDKHAARWRYWQPGTEPVHGHPAHDVALSGDRPLKSDRWAFTVQLAQDISDANHGQLQSGEHKVTVYTGWAAS